MKDIRFSKLSLGFKVFTDWADNLLALPYDIHYGKQERFLSWQTWDELRLTVLGFEGFYQHFFEKLGGYFIVPLRANGSALETIFGQLKNQKGACSKLSAADYGFRWPCERKINLHGQHAQDDYHNTELYVQEAPLKGRRKVLLQED
eukprot:Pompholyxophrys_punicea_v1_NODE_317_length_2277_cov_3.387663.p2 type:complete len:147 gc:universal NODE_317_length_2277_cov_3.387663:505-65(-)